MISNNEFIRCLLQFSIVDVFMNIILLFSCDDYDYYPSSFFSCVYQISLFVCFFVSYFHSFFLSFFLLFFLSFLPCFFLSFFLSFFRYLSIYLFISNLLHNSCFTQAASSGLSEMRKPGIYSPRLQPGNPSGYIGLTTVFFIFLVY